MDVLDSRKNDDLPIFRAYCERVLKQHAEKMDQTMRGRMSGFRESFWNSRSIRTDDTSLFYTHLPVHRFNDMKTRIVGDRKIQRKNHKIHNQIIMGHYNGIQLDLTYGMTEQVKEDLRAQFAEKNIEISL